MNAVSSDPMLTQPHRIKALRKETSDTFTFELRRTDASTMAPFKPGQFNMLYVYGIGEVAISISGDPAEPDTLVHTTRAVGTVTRAMDRLRAGQVIGVRGTHGHGWSSEDAEGQDLGVIGVVAAAHVQVDVVDDFATGVRRVVHGPILDLEDRLADRVFARREPVGHVAPDHAADDAILCDGVLAAV